MRKSCESCGAVFVIEKQDLSFYQKISPVIGGVEFSIPVPKRCPSCRLQRRMAWRNQIYVFPRPSSFTGKRVFSNFPEESPFPVTGQEEWWSDSWDELSFGREVDFSRPFFEQFLELRNQVPHPCKAAGGVWENSDYCNNASDIKNCYLVFNTAFAEDCLCCENAYRSRDCLESTHTTESELCYDCVMCARCYNLQSSWECADCSDSYFLLNCRSCQNCFGCVNLQHKQYCVFNEQYSRETYRDFIGGLALSSYVERQTLRRRAEEFWLKHPRPHVVTQQVENVSGNYIFQSKHVQDSFFVRNGENLRYCFNVQEGVKDCYDYLLPGIRAELQYECVQCHNGVFNLQFCYLCGQGCSDLRYCWICYGSEDCFGCAGLRKKRYCVLNRQYTREEYEALVPKLIAHMQSTGEWGEYFPVEHAPLPYNRSYAQRYYPLSRQEVKDRGLWWCDKHEVRAEDAVSSSELPDGLPGTDEPITVKSALSGVPFRISREEIRRARELGVPLPRLTYDERMEERARYLGRIRLHERNCARTGKPLRSPWPPGSPWIIWDKEEYEKEFFS